MRWARARGARGLLGAILVWATFACGGEQVPAAAETIPREVFVDTYVELRMAALHSPDGRVGPAARAEILEAKGVTEADLLEYVDVHGNRVQYMVEVWAEIDDTLRALRTEDDPAPAS